MLIRFNPKNIVENTPNYILNEIELFNRLFEAPESTVAIFDDEIRDAYI